MTDTELRAILAARTPGELRWEGGDEYEPARLMAGDSIVAEACDSGTNWQTRLLIDIHPKDKAAIAAAVNATIASTVTVRFNSISATWTSRRAI